MDYFSLSPFWDPNSNNAVIKMQTTNNSIDQANMDLT
jgi:mediator of RNA polymerase II transcription subunit 6